MIKRILIPTDGYGLEDHVIKYVSIRRVSHNKRGKHL